MPIRIYALAKDLGVDSKTLAEHCERLGIPGKGSAFASLEDDEVQRVVEYLGNRGTVHAASPAIPLKVQALASGPASAPIAAAPYVPSSKPMSLPAALAIEQLHMQVVELGTIVESLTLMILDTSDNGTAFRAECDFCALIDAAFSADVFFSLSANDLHSARMVRNCVAHRGNRNFPSDSELRRSRNSFVLALLDLLVWCGPSWKAGVLTESKQYFPKNKRRRSGPPGET